MSYKTLRYAIEDGIAVVTFDDDDHVISERIFIDSAAIAAQLVASDYLDRSQARPVDARLSEVLAAPDDLSTARALADVACLSPSRLREIVSRDFGVPPAKLLQWLQLQRAVRTLVGGGGLADAAAAGGFADQSHFTRRCAQWLGVTPSAGLSAFAFEIVS